jgi:hypothetical protein
VTGTDQHGAPPRRPVAIWHQHPRGPARATALTEPVSTLPRAALARLIAQRVLGDPDARVVIDHVVTLPPDTPMLPADQEPLDLGEHELDEAGEQVPEVADPAAGTVRVLSRRCASCIYRRAMRAALGPSVPALIREARDTGGFVICHETLPAWPSDGAHIPPAICHGYAAQFPDTFALRVARAIGHIELIDPPPAAPHPAHETEQ